MQINVTELPHGYEEFLGTYTYLGVWHESKTINDGEAYTRVWPDGDRYLYLAKDRTYGFNANTEAKWKLTSAQDQIDQLAQALDKALDVNQQHIEQSIAMHDRLVKAEQQVADLQILINSMVIAIDVTERELRREIAYLKLR